MKSIQQIKDEWAIDREFKDWKNTPDAWRLNAIDSLMLRMAEEVKKDAAGLTKAAIDHIEQTDKVINTSGIDMNTYGNGVMNAMHGLQSILNIEIKK